MQLVEAMAHVYDTRVEIVRRGERGDEAGWCKLSISLRADLGGGGWQRASCQAASRVSGIRTDRRDRFVGKKTKEA